MLSYYYEARLENEDIAFELRQQMGQRQEAHTPISFHIFRTYANQPPKPPCRCRWFTLEVEAAISLEAATPVSVEVVIVQ